MTLRLQHGIADVEREIEIQLHTRRANLWSSSSLVLHFAYYLSAFPTIITLLVFFFFRIPSLSGRGFYRRALERASGAVRSTGALSPRNTTVVRDNDNQRVKWGLISFGRGRVERDAIESGGGGAAGRGTGAGRKMRVYTCQETRRLVHNIGGPCADRRGQKGGGRGEDGRGERKETRGWL